MSGVKDSDRLNSVRERLYARGTESDRVVRHGLMEKNKEVAETWEVIKSRQQNPTTDIRKSISSDVERSQPESVVPTAEAIGEEPIENMTKKSKKSYRVIIMLVSIIGFVVVAGLASLFLLFGGNQISGRNIDISLTGPFSASGGEVLPIQVGITNQNSVAIESVVLVVNYPPGTRSADEEPRDLFEERLPLDNIESGEALNVPVRVSLFGEENEEKEINARIEYRLKDSNGRYEKVAEPLKVKIKSSPLVIGIDSVKTVSSGQEIDVTLNVRSNSQVTLKDILVSADYPDSFDFNSSEPSPMYGQNTWLIEEIDPDEEIKIVISGLVIGLVEEESVIKFNAGNPQTDNQFIMGSILAKAETNYTIEKPFIDVGISIGTTRTNQAVIEYGKDVRIQVDVNNTLKESIYDMVMEVSVGGNVIDEKDVKVAKGYYNSVKDVVRWDVSSDDKLEEVEPGRSRDFTFEIKPNAVEDKASMQVRASVYARRVLGNEVSEELIGFADASVKFTSSLLMLGEAGRNTSSFTDIGPIPPKAEETTTYTLTLVAQAGANDIVNAKVETSLPQYVEWLDNVNGVGSIEYNPITKKIVWSVGDVDARERAQTSFQVALQPSKSLIDETPVLLGVQELRATDRFTNTTIHATGLTINTEMSEEAGYEEGNGEVVE